METKVATKRIFDSISRKYIDVNIENDYYTKDGEKLYRIETKGKKGKKLYSNGYYLNTSTGKELPVHGMDGATGHGWGGRVMGYLTKEEATKLNIAV